MSVGDISKSAYIGGTLGTIAGCCIGGTAGALALGGAGAAMGLKAGGWIFNAKLANKVADELLKDFHHIINTSSKYLFTGGVVAGSFILGTQSLHNFCQLPSSENSTTCQIFPNIGLPLAIASVAGATALIHKNIKNLRHEETQAIEVQQQLDKSISKAIDKYNDKTQIITPYVSRETKINPDSLRIHNELSELEETLSKAKVSTTFWGYRIVTIEGSDHPLSLDDFAEKILKIGHSYYDNKCLDSKTSQLGLKLVSKIEGFYKSTDGQLKNRNFITRFFNWLREDNCVLNCLYFLCSPRSNLELFAAYDFVSRHRRIT